LHILQYLLGQPNTFLLLAAADVSLPLKETIDAVRSEGGGFNWVVVGLLK
jgi:hypothetical protein